MGAPFAAFGGIDFSGAREPLSNLWTALGSVEDGRLRIVELRPHAFRADLAAFVLQGWRSPMGAAEGGRILWGADFPFGLPLEVGDRTGEPRGWERIVAWVADRPPDEVRSVAGDAARSCRAADTGSALPPLDMRLYKQTVEGLRWIHELREEGRVAIHPQALEAEASISLIEVYPSSTVQELGLPRRRTPSRPGEARARAAALRTYLDFADPAVEALAVTLEDAWDATVACLTAFLCRDDLEQPFRASDLPRERVELEGWIYRPPDSLQ
jgi:hypothetical protein